MSEVTGRIVLSEPIETRIRDAGGAERTETLNEVTVRPAVAGDLRVMDKEPGDVGKMLALMARLTGLDQRTIDKLALKDFGTIAEAIEGFMPAGLKTGVTSSAP